MNADGSRNITARAAASQGGSVIVYLVAIILVAGVLGLGLVSMTTTSTFTGLGYNPSDQARFLAKSGLEYARTLGDPDLEQLKFDNGEVVIGFTHLETVGQIDYYDITSTGTVYGGEFRESSFTIVAFNVPIGEGIGETDVDFPDDGSKLEEYWDDVGLSDAKYTDGGQSDDGALIFQGEQGLLGLNWGKIEGLDLKGIRDISDGLLSYELQLKTKIRPQGNNGQFYMVGLSFRLETSGSSIQNGYGLSFFRYTPGVGSNQRPGWANDLAGFDGLKDGIPYLVLWKRINEGDITLIDYADLQYGHDESFVNTNNQGDKDLNDWVTMAVRVEEKQHPSGEGTENHITAYIQQPQAIQKDTKEWDYSKYLPVNWNQHGVGNPIIDDSLDSSGVDYIGDIEIDPPNYEYEIGVHAFYDGNPSNQVFLADFGLKF